MRFNIDVDAGQGIFGWLTPDNPSAIPRFLVEVPGLDPIEFDANQLREDVRDFGLHNTGMVGFKIDRSLVPGLEPDTPVSLFEAAQRVNIYTRFDPVRHIEGKLVLLDASAMPQWRLLQGVRNRFAMYHGMIERLPLETINSILSNNYCGSMLVAGAPNFNRYRSQFEDRGYKVVALIRDPFDELAERLLFCNALARAPGTGARSTHFASLEPLIRFAGTAPLNDEKALATAFRKAGDDQRALMRSPMTRLFGSTVEEPPDRRHVSIALDNLSHLELVGTRSGFGEFCRVINGLVEIELFSEHTMTTIPGTTDLARTLSRIGQVADLLDEDLALYSFAEEAITGTFGAEAAA